MGELKLKNILDDFNIIELCDGLSVSKGIVTLEIAEVLNGEFLKTSELYDTLATQLAMHTTLHPDYGLLAGRVIYQRIKNQAVSLEQITSYGQSAGIFSEVYSKEMLKYAKRLDHMIDDSRSLKFDYFSIKTIESSYLAKANGFIETPEQMYMRVAFQVSEKNLKSIVKTYNLLSEGYYTHASPVMYNSGAKRAQLASCFLSAIESDSVEGIMNCIQESAIISKNSGGIGVHLSNIRSKGSKINSSGGEANGIIPVARLLNETVRFVSQAGGRRKGAIAAYLEPWHADIESFLDLKLNTGKEEMRARDIFLALWVPDLFMKRVEEDLNWSLFSPDDCPGLDELYGEEFDKKYTEYESLGLARTSIKARDLMKRILKSQIETGVPYILFKDSCNEKSNQKNLGTIKSSNLCAEIIEYSSDKETAVCNLASISLPRFLIKDDNESLAFDYTKLGEVTEQIIENLNLCIERNFYPDEKTKNSNQKHRPLGVGVQGLADVFMKLEIEYGSKRSAQINDKIFACIYFHSLKKSCELAKEHGPYKSFHGSPLSKGMFQFDLWGQEPHRDFDWQSLRAHIMKNGTRNSLLIALMPTATTSIVLGNTESFEMQTSNLHRRQIGAGEFIQINKHLIADLAKVGLWSEEVRQKLIKANGSIQDIEEIPKHLKNIYLTVWEVSQKKVIDLAADRGKYVCQSQSMNLYMADPKASAINSMIFYAWKKGLKTGMYYFRTKAKLLSPKFTTDQSSDESAEVCEIDCESCGS